MRIVVVRGRCDVYIGRPSLFGNPYSVNNLRTRELVMGRFDMYIERHPELVKELYALCKATGKPVVRLGCHCAPLPCHGDILKRELDKLIGNK